MVKSFVQWTLSTGIGDWVQYHTWMFPGGETLHFMGLSLLVGTVTIFDLRMLGLGKSLPLAPLLRLLNRWGVAGFLTCFLTGVMFWTVNAPLYAIDVGWVFGLKLLCILLAGMNVLVFRYTVMPQVIALGPGEEAPPLAKVIAVASLMLWAGVIWFGRMLMFT